MRPNVKLEQRLDVACQDLTPLFLQLYLMLKKAAHSLAHGPATRRINGGINLGLQGHGAGKCGEHLAVVL